MPLKRLRVCVDLETYEWLLLLGDGSPSRALFRLRHGRKAPERRGRPKLARITPTEKKAHIIGMETEVESNGP